MTSLTILDEQGRPLEHVTAPLNYLAETDRKPIAYKETPGVSAQGPTERFSPRMVPVYDARGAALEFSLDRQGFALIDRPSVVSDFYDAEQIRTLYYPEAQRIIESATGASRVFIFDHTIRADMQATRDRTEARGPARSVHNDYTEGSGPQRVRDLLPDEAESLLRNRVAIVNLWRPIVGPVKTTPLALADASSIAERDWVRADLVYPDRVGEIYYSRFNPRHRWFYFSDMQPNEALLIKVYDSAVDGRARFAAHTAFDGPTVAPDAPGRESIELRTLVFFEDEPAEGWISTVAGARSSLAA